MSPNNKDCQCPLCKQRFIPENGDSPEEHLARGIIRVFSKLQKEERQIDLPCPRCGQKNMNSVNIHNAKSGYADVYICNQCGEDEALDAAKNYVFPLSCWYIVLALIASYQKEMSK